MSLTFTIQVTVTDIGSQLSQSWKTHQNCIVYVAKIKFVISFHGTKWVGEYLKMILEVF